ncbi:MAG: hypothetical protein IJH37_01470 [Clostridia bacterium]|nr:hypothetical protein [Clostridia bacterium]
MKMFETPELKISVFENENAVTTSGGGPQTTAVEQAMNDAQNGAVEGSVEGSVGTLSVDLW